MLITDDHFLFVKTVPASLPTVSHSVKERKCVQEIHLIVHENVSEPEGEIIQ